jgi:hypothetical protein
MDPTPFFINFKDAKILFFLHIFFIFFLFTCPQAHHLQSKKFNFLLKFCVKILFCRHYFSPLNAFMIKGKDPDPDPQHWFEQCSNEDIDLLNLYSKPFLYPEPKFNIDKKLKKLQWKEKK